MDRIAVITGTSSNLGTNIAYRLLEGVPSEDKLTIVVTSRTLTKAKDTIQEIKKYNDDKVHRKGLLSFDYLLIDFGNMVSILGAVYELKKNYDKIDYVFINAAQGTYAGIDWIQATKECLTNPVKASTYPQYKIEQVGVKSKDDMGLVFQANAFGPYYLVEKIKEPLLSKSDDARVVWISSIMGTPASLSFDDLQLLKSDVSYEGSKREVDLLHLATYQDLHNRYGITQYVTQPGIFVSFSFFRFLNVFTYYGMIALFYIARLLGSPWHNLTGWNAADAPIFVCLKADPNIDLQALKWGSASTVTGKEYIKTTEIDPTGKSDVLKYFREMERQWDDKLKDQIADTRRAY